MTNKDLTQDMRDVDGSSARSIYCLQKSHEKWFHWKSVKLLQNSTDFLFFIF